MVAVVSRQVEATLAERYTPKQETSAGVRPADDEGGGRVSAGDPAPRSVAAAAAASTPGGRRAAFARQVRDALAHLYDPIYLQTHPLASLVVRDANPRAPGVGTALRQALLEAVDALQPLRETSDSLPSATGYPILQLRYVEALDVPSIQTRLAIGRSEYYREQQRAVDAIVSLLWDRWAVGRGLAAGPPEVGVASPEPDSVAGPQPPRHNLPMPTTTYVARRGELPQVVQRLRESRLLTLTGSGGSGKTRLALEVARDLLTVYAAGVWLVELAPLTDPLLVPQAIATALGVREASDRPLLATVVDYLRGRAVLLILDSCEHLIDACARVADTLLRTSERLQILATSRELLGITGEAIWRVPALAMPEPPAAAASPEDLAAAVRQSEAGQLFADRARLGSPSFTVTAENAAAVEKVCRRLDGIPLAIELAAARVAVLSVDQIAARLDQRFRLLTGGSRTALPWQQTLRPTIDWSHQLLSDDERALWRRLAVFVGGWTPEAAEAVGASSEGGVGADDVLDLLVRLAAKSMILVEEPASSGRAARRFRLSETTRPYAEEKLLDAGEAAMARDRHRDWFVGLAEQAMVGMEGPDQKQWFEGLEAEHGNLRAALAWALEGPEGAEPLLRLAAALGRFWQSRGYPQEGRRWLEIALQGAPGPTEARARALNWLGQLARLHGDAERARQLLAESVALARTGVDRRLLSIALRHGYRTSLALGDRQEARRLLDEAVAVSRDQGDQRELAYNLCALAELRIDEGRLDGAERLLAEILDVGRSAGDALPLCDRLVVLGAVRLLQGDPARARSALVEALDLERAVGSTFITPQALALLGDVARSQGDLPEALDRYGEGLRLSQVMGRGDLAATLRRYAGVCAAVGEPRQAARLFGAASTVADESRRLAWVDRYFGADDPAAARQALGDEAFAAAWAEGRAITLEDAAWGLGGVPAPKQP
jgi:predicted ATPase